MKSTSTSGGFALLLGLASGCARSTSDRQAPSSTALPSSAPQTTVPPPSTSGSASPSASGVAPSDPPMVTLPKGGFQQGAAGATGDDIDWSHWEIVPSFALDVTEVTVAAYRKCIAAGVCVYPPRSPQCNLERSQQFETDPVNCVTWMEAETFCDWRVAVLPTQAMWEYADGGLHGWEWPSDPRLFLHLDPDKDRLYAGEGICKDRTPSAQARLLERAGPLEKTTCPVGSLPRGDTPEGVKDMEGNVAEWTSSIYCQHPDRLCQGEKRVVKGDSYDGMTSGYVGRRQRFAYPASAWVPAIGFRCARLPK